MGAVAYYSVVATLTFAQLTLGDFADFAFAAEFEERYVAAVAAAASAVVDVEVVVLPGSLAQVRGPGLCRYEG